MLSSRSRDRSPTFGEVTHRGLASGAEKAGLCRRGTQLGSGPAFTALGGGLGPSRAPSGSVMEARGGQPWCPPCRPSARGLPDFHAVQGA